jgi:hypothetical protein
VFRPKQLAHYNKNQIAISQPNIKSYLSNGLIKAVPTCSTQTVKKPGSTLGKRNRQIGNQKLIQKI